MPHPCITPTRTGAHIIDTACPPTVAAVPLCDACMQVEKAATKKFEDERAQRRAEWLAESRRFKQQANAEKARRAAEEKATRDAEVKARFKASEAERVQREAEKRALEKEEARKLREAQRQKNDEEHRKKKAEAREKARALKEALREAAALQYEADERGKMRKKADPTEELHKAQREMEAEQAKEMRARDMEIEAKAAAYEKKKKEQEHQRRLETEAAHREVTAIFKRNQEKAQADRLAREAAEKQRYAKIARAESERIQNENHRRLEAEREAAINLKVRSGVDANSQEHRPLVSVACTHTRARGHTPSLRGALGRCHCTVAPPVASPKVSLHTLSRAGSSAADCCSGPRLVYSRSRLHAC